MGEPMSRQVQNALGVIAIVLTSPIWATLLWNMLTPFGTSEAVAIGIFGALLGTAAVLTGKAKRKSRHAENGQGPSGAVDV